MALCLHFECCAKRFISPTRLGVQANGVHQDSSCKPTFPTSHTSIASEVSSRNLIPMQLLRNKSSFISVKHILPGMQNILSSVKYLRHSLKEFKYKGAPDMVKDKVSNLVSALNVDIPPRKTIRSDIENSQSPLHSACEKTKSVLENTSGSNMTSAQSEHEREKPWSIERKNEQIQIEREWHDLHEAMACNFRSVSAFCSDARWTDKTSNVVKSEHETVPNKGTSSSFEMVLTELEEEKTEVPGLWHRIYANLPNIDLRSRLPVRKDVKGEKNIIIKKTTKISRAAVNSRTRTLTKSLKTARSNISRVVRLEDLAKHLHEFPEAKVVTIQEEVIPLLLMLRNNSDVVTREQTHELLAQLGFVDSVKGQGIRILALDGGGTRGLISIKILQELERQCEKSICEMFDYICGVSTGSLIATLIAVHKIPLHTCEDIYQEFSKKVFDRTRTAGAVNLVTSHAYYDAVVWEDVLKSEIGDLSFSETARDASCPKLSAVSAIVNVEKIQNYLFRNYEYPEGMSSHYLGSMHHKLWHGIKASSAAPGYFAECKVDDYVHQDGGLLTNNPTAIAIHETQLLWPQTPLQCVVSVGTGKYEPAGGHYRDPNLSSLKEKLLKIVQSATDTEAVHSTMLDLLPSCYFRFNPYISEDFLLDEVREEKWNIMYEETEAYCRRNQPKFKTAADILQKPKLPHQKMKDWLYLKSNLHNLPSKVLPKSKKKQ